MCATLTPKAAKTSASTKTEEAARAELFSTTDPALRREAETAHSRLLATTERMQKGTEKVFASPARRTHAASHHICCSSRALLSLLPGPLRNRRRHWMPQPLPPRLLRSPITHGRSFERLERRRWRQRLSVLTSWLIWRRNGRRWSALAPRSRSQTLALTGLRRLSLGWDGAQPPTGC